MQWTPMYSSLVLHSTRLGTGQAVEYEILFRATLTSLLATAGTVRRDAATRNRMGRSIFYTVLH